jgi:predicted CoA-binding protein
MAHKELTGMGYEIFPIHPRETEINGVKCYPDLAAVKDEVEGALVFVKPESAVLVLREAAENGISHIWLQQGSSNDEVIALGKELGLEMVHGKCIMMYTREVKSVHRFHRWLWKLIGQY